MSTIAPGRLFNVSDAASFVALSQQNWVILSEEVFRRLVTYQNRIPNTLNGPPTTGMWGQFAPIPVIHEVIPRPGPVDSRGVSPPVIRSAPASICQKDRSDPIAFQVYS